MMELSMNSKLAMRLLLMLVIFLLALSLPRLVAAQESEELEAPPERARPQVDCVEAARGLRMQRRFSEAEKTARACTEEQQGNPDAWVELARALAAQGNSEEALTWVDKALLDYPDSNDLKLLKARLLAWTDQLDAARKLLETLPEDLYERPEAMRLRADILLWDDSFDEAIEWYNRYDEADPDNPLVLYKRAMAHRGAGDDSKALEDLEKSCEIAPDATNACKAHEGIAEDSYPKLYANILYGYSRIINRLDGWRLRGDVGSELSRNLTLMGTWEWLHRPFFDHRAADWRFNAWGDYKFDSGLFFKAGGGFAIDPIFSPKWNALVEAGWSFEYFQASARYWHIEFPDESNEVLNANAEIYIKPYMFELRYFMTFSDDGDPVAHSGLGRAFYFFSNLTQFYIGGGGGGKSDYLEPRDINSESHWLVTAGFRYMLTSHHRLLIAVTQRHDSAGTQNYDQTEVLGGYEFRL